MADRGDTHYSVPTLNKWFMLSSVLLLVATFWMVIDDWNAPWKKYQGEFRRVEVVRTRQAIESEAMQQQARNSAAVQVLLDEAEARLKANHEQVAQTKEELFLAKGDLFVVSEATKKAKQNLAWERYWIEEHRNESGDPSYGEAKLQKFTQTFVDLDAESGLKTAAVTEIEARLTGLTAEVKELEGKRKGARVDLELLETKLSKLAPESETGKIANLLRDFPGIDFVDPRNKVKKQVLGDLTFELNFTKGARIDMCQTCHEGIDRSGFTSDLVVDGAPLDNPYLSHPNLDLYLSSSSPHPVNKVGCTICHRGSGQALDFIRADHRPAGEKQEEQWIADHHWHKEHHWDYPMLSNDFVEASCVQCHKTSMELIAKDAPRVTDGYRLFEDKGCYACHKVEWLPTKRRPGPTLANLQTKLDRTWVESWVANPTNFRPDTRMPRIFHLSNYKPEQELGLSAWGSGRMMYGQEWNDTSIAAVSAYLFEKGTKKDLAPIPVKGDAARGRETFRLAGCLACHNMAPYPGQNLKTSDLAFEHRGENQHGPDLRGVASKVDRTWLYNWIKDPKAYWSETKMPNLRLTDQEAADITSYMMDDPDGIFQDVPAVWEPANSPYDTEVLREMARWFFSREGRPELERRFAGESADHRWDRDEDLLLAIGEKQIGHQGCFSCHEIPGFEETNPIGTELTTWGSKTVDKLAWDFRAKILTEEHGWTFHQREEFKHYRENWAYEKLANPRIFDEEMVRNPIERARMPDFGLTDDEIKSLTTFLVGLVDDEVPRAKMMPTPAQAEMDAGARVVRQQNCMACHVIDPGRVTFKTEDGVQLTVAAEPAPIGDAATPPTMDSLEGYRAQVAAYEADAGEEVEDIGFRLLEVVPALGKMPGESIFITKDQLVGVQKARGGDFVRLVLDYYKHGIELFDPNAAAGEQHYAWNYGKDGAVLDVDGVPRAYHGEHYDTIRWALAPPVLIDEGTKLQPDWFYSFLLDPSQIRQQMRVRMPTFNITPDQAGSVVDYFANKAVLEWSPRYARALRMSMSINPKRGLEGRGLPWPELINQVAEIDQVSLEDAARLYGIKPDQVAAIEAGNAADIAANFAKVKKYGDSIDFHMSQAVDPHHEAIAQRSTSYEPQVDVGRTVAVEGVICFKCHWLNASPPEQKDAPSAWAPNLGVARERLRPDWVRDWLWSPPFKYPGSAMAVNFGSEDPLYQEQYPNSTNAQQIEAVLDWLYTLDRADSAAKN